MSALELYVITKKGDVEYLGDARNSQCASYSPS